MKNGRAFQRNNVGFIASTGMGGWSFHLVKQVRPMGSRLEGQVRSMVLDMLNLRCLLKINMAII